MTWVRLDDQFHRNPKALKMSDAAHRIYVDALSYCSECKVLTGFLSTPEAEAFIRGRKKSMTVAAELVELDAWEQGPDGYLIHDFERYVPPRSQPAVIEWRSNKRAEWESNRQVIGDQSAIEATLGADSSRAARFPIPEPVPVGSKEPPVIPLQPETFGLSRQGAQVDGFHGIKTVLGGLRIQPEPRKETA